MEMLNINVGILGHVDSGKTTLARALSKISSTAAFDKHPQSKERGITIDLGFSAVVIDTPVDLHQENSQNKENPKLQLTIVDCPGHSTLIRTIIGGAHIVDIILLVIDAQKGIQTQTAECLVLSEIICKNLVVVLNKIDLFDEAIRETKIKNIELKIRKTFKSTIYGDNVPILNVSALKGNHIDKFLDDLKKFIKLPNRDTTKPFLMAVDHCFSIKGKGTICTGTVIEGKISVGDTVEIPQCKEQKKVKSIQSFHKSVQSIQQGDRAGVCLTQFNSSAMERGYLCQSECVKEIFATIIPLKKIKYYNNAIKSKTKYHISVGHETVMGKIILFCSENSLESENFDAKQEYEYMNEFSGELLENRSVFAVIEFEIPILSAINALIIGSKLDLENTKNSCRLAFYGKMQWVANDSSYKEKFLQNLKICKQKEKRGFVCRVSNRNEVIVEKLFKKGVMEDFFLRKKVYFVFNKEGFIESTFGKSMKVKVNIPNGLSDDEISLLKSKKGNLVLFRFKKFIFNKSYVECV